MGNSLQQYRSSIGRFHSKISSSSWKRRSTTNAKDKFERNINFILHVLTIATIKAEVGDLVSSVISVCQIFLFFCTYSVLLVSALNIFFSSKSLSEYPSINPSNNAHYHDTSTLNYESEVCSSQRSTVQKGTEAHAKKQHKSTVHFNAKNLGDY